MMNLQVWLLLHDVNHELKSDELLDRVTVYSTERACVASFIRILKAEYENAFEMLVDEHDSEQVLSEMSVDELLGALEEIDGYVAAKLCIKKKKIR